ncbi:MAG: dienelactone hydrolase family protein [Deltaproteobacteria bacterium]|nr:dienelactone hydrolase family protein [Deltaproteobacteria bacterium]
MRLCHCLAIAACALAWGAACNPGVEMRDGGPETSDGGGRDRPAGSDWSGGWDLALRDGAPGQDSAVVGTLTPGSSTLQLSVAGSMREVLLVVPNEVLSNQRPLVIALHGNGDTPGNFLASTGLASAAAARGVILAAPQGIAQTFPYGNQTLTDIDWDAYRTEDEGNIDLPLIDAVYRHLIGTSSVSLGKVHLFGYSQGGYLAFRGAMEKASSLAAAVVVAAANPLPGSSLVADAARPIPIALTIGENDYAISLARQTRTELENAGHEVRYEEIAGAGHVPFPGDAAALLDWLLAHSLY